MSLKSRKLQVFIESDNLPADAYPQASLEHFFAFSMLSNTIGGLLWKERFGLEMITFYNIFMDHIFNTNISDFSKKIWPECP